MTEGGQPSTAQSSTSERDTDNNATVGYSSVNPASMKCKKSVSVPLKELDTLSKKMEQDPIKFHNRFEYISYGDLSNYGDL